MSGYSSTTVFGHIGVVQQLREVQNKQTGEIRQVLNFTVAFNDPFDGSTTWYNCALWGDRAAKIDQFIAPGQQVLVIGNVKARVYEDKEGFAAVSMDMRVDQIQFADAKSEKTEGNAKLKVRPEAQNEISEKMKELTGVAVQPAKESAPAPANPGKLVRPGRGAAQAQS